MAQLGMSTAAHRKYFPCVSRRTMQLWVPLCLLVITVLGGLVIRNPLQLFTTNTTQSPMLTKIDKVVTSPSGQTAFVMLAHDLSPNVVAEFEHLLSDSNSRNVFMMFHEASRPFREAAMVLEPSQGGVLLESLKEGRVVIVNDSLLRGFSPTFESAWENLQTLLVAFYRLVLEKHPQYSYVWFQESDVRCSGDYKRTFAKADGLAEDFLALWVVGKTDNWGAALHPWNWHRLQGVNMEERYGAFLPVMRLSLKALKVLSESASSNVTGFCEIYIPSVVHINGGTVGSLPKEMFGEFRYRPQMVQAEYEILMTERSDALFHPVI